MKFLTLAFALLVLHASTTRAQAELLSPERQREILHKALDDYDNAVAVGREDPARAVQLYRESAAGFNALVDAGLHNAALEYDLGNVYFRLGELGRAIVHYRRALRLAPADQRLDANLRYARDRVEPPIAPSGQHRLARQFLFWHYETSLAQRTTALLILTAVGWGLLFAWLGWRRRPLAVMGLVGVALSLAAGVSVRWQIEDEARQPHAVIVADQQYLRLGRGEGSDLAIKQPLGSGVELRILQQRGGWIEVRLANDQTGWLPADSVQRV